MISTWFTVQFDMGIIEDVLSLPIKKITKHQLNKIASKKEKIKDVLSFSIDIEDLM